MCPISARPGAAARPAAWAASTARKGSTLTWRPSACSCALLSAGGSWLGLAGPGLEGFDERAGDGLVAALFRDQQQAREVQRNARATEDGQDREGDPDDRRVDAEVTGQARGDA